MVPSPTRVQLFQVPCETGCGKAMSDLDATSAEPRCVDDQAAAPSSFDEAGSAETASAILALRDRSHHAVHFPYSMGPYCSQYWVALFGL